MPEHDLDDRIRALLHTAPLPPLAAAPSAQLLRSRSRARARRRRLAVAGTAVALVAGIGWHAGASGHGASTPPAGTPSISAHPAATRAELAAVRATVAEYYGRLPQASGAAADAERKALERIHLAASALAQAAASPQDLGGPARDWPAVCGNPTTPLHVGPLHQTGPGRATANVSGAPGPTVITVSLATGLITSWTCT
ncbi:hypothetical protein [Streptomyces sp. NPDC020917]|uniref:hypothetical protein n=1 Tax=Streptomyces sp. NPDC020917 TaxID=3365102 RepID=UPI00379C5436